MRKAVAMVLVATLAVTGCGAQVSEGDSGAVPAGYPVTVTNCGSPLTVQRPPSRVVTNDIGITELMFALGLGDRMAGYVVGQGQSGGVASSPWKGDFAKVRELAEKINREVVQGVGADLVSPAGTTASPRAPASPRTPCGSSASPAISSPRPAETASANSAGSCLRSTRCTPICATSARSST